MAHTLSNHTRPCISAGLNPPAAGSHIAYSYSVTYAFDRSTVAEVQGQQLDLCRRLGTERCLVVRSSLNTPGPDDHVVTDEAVLMIEAKRADAVTRRFDAIADGFPPLDNLAFGHGQTDFWHEDCGTHEPNASRSRFKLERTGVRIR